jgi:queuine tRNA-ribosyltransferase
MMLLTWANLAYYQDLMQGLRSAISERRVEHFAAETKAGWRAGDLALYDDTLGK